MAKSNARLKVVPKDAGPTPNEHIAGLRHEEKFRELPRQAGALADSISSDASRLSREVRGTVFQQADAKTRIQIMRRQLDALEALL